MASRSSATAVASVSGMARTVAIVPHTHWDREWYQPFQAFRLRLVDLLDDFLPRLDRDPAYARFLLDGQMAVVDDYLAIRPDAEPLLRRLAAAGRLAVGPWYILMDEFLVSGETIVRNLQLGFDRAASFGGAMPVGYLPDMFGHIAQMPQILRLAGLQHAVVWRGVPSVVNKTAFWWRAPDGSVVRAEYLPVGYSNGSAVPDEAKALVRRIQAHEKEIEPMLLGRAAPLLIMNGTDHQVPQPWLGRMVAEVNAMQDDYHLVVTSLPEYLASAPSAPGDGLPSWTGELRSGARANLLMGVTSNRVDVRRAAARAERALEQQAEPLCALWLPSEKWPAEELAVAWLQVIRNSAHDSICACSTDDVGLAVLHRFAEAHAIADGLRRKAVRLAGASMATAGPVIVNPSARARSGVVEITVAGDPAVGAVEGGQMVEALPAGTREVVGLGADLPLLIGQLSDEGWLVAGGGGGGLELEAGDDGVQLTIHVGRGQRGGADAQSVMAEAWAQAGAHRDLPLTVRVERDGWQRVAVHQADVPGFGWASWSPGPLTVPPVVAGEASLGNGIVDVVVDLDCGTWSVGDLAGLDRLVDQGDEGDTYNYSPPAHDLLVDQPENVFVDVVEAGPVRGRLRVRRAFRWPERLQGGKRTGEVPVVVATDVELRAGEALVRARTTLVNRCRDHRLRTVFPLPAQALFSRAECAFGIVERGLAAEGGPHERGLATYPSRRFVSAGGLTLLHDGVLEYELVDSGGALALTLLRATGMLSRDRMSYRADPAGPSIAVEGPQLQGPVQVEYAIHVGDQDPYLLAEQAWLPLEVARGTGTGDRSDRGSLLTVTGAEVSALHRVGSALELRVFNPTSEEVAVRIDGRAGWLVDLRGTPTDSFDDVFPLRPWGIATARLAP